MSGITLVLANGGARGCSFIGVTRVLQQYGIPVSEVVGASMGAIIGAAICSGKQPDDLLAIAKGLRLRTVLRPSFGGPGLLSTKGLAKLIDRFVSVVRFEDLEIPLKVVCTDLNSGRPVVFDKGPLKQPLLASSVPAGLFDPVWMNGRVLADGGYALPFPIGLGSCGNRELLIDPLVEPVWPLSIRRGFSFLNLISPCSIWQMLLKSFDITSYHFAQTQLSQSDILHVRPDLEPMKFYDFSKAEFAANAGETAMRKAITEDRLL